MTPEDALPSDETRVKLRDGHMLASKLSAFSSASATNVKPSATKLLDFGIGDAPELMASTSACTLRKVNFDESPGRNDSGELKETGAKENSGTCSEVPLV